MQFETPVCRGNLRVVGVRGRKRLWKRISTICLLALAGVGGYFEKQQTNIRQTLGRQHINGIFKVPLSSELALGLGLGLG